MKWRSESQLNKIMMLPDTKLLDCLAIMDEAALQILLVVNDSGQLVGIVTDGDVRRHVLLNGLDPKSSVADIMNPNARSLPINTSINDAKEVMIKYSIRHIPLVDGGGRVRDLIVWSDFFSSVAEVRAEKVVIMAGGKGTRLDPFTRILPKPMIPLGDKPIIEVIMDKFHKQGFSNFILSLGYKAEIIKMYFSEAESREYNVEFICESQPLGTAGALSLMKDRLPETFLVTNCDVIFEPSFKDVLTHHRDQGNDLTLLGTVKEFAIPYGVLKTDGQDLLEIEEKPNIHYLVNTGLYVVEPRVLDLIGPDEFIHIPELLYRIKEKGGKVGVYPHHGNWFDVGQWEDYRNALRYFGAME